MNNRLICAKCSHKVIHHEHTNPTWTMCKILDCNCDSFEPEMSDNDATERVINILKRQATKT